MSSVEFKPDTTGSSASIVDQGFCDIGKRLCASAPSP